MDDGTFKFLEGPDQRTEGFRRYTLDGHGGLEDVEISELSSEYGYRETFETAPGGITVMERVVYELDSEARLATAASLTYMGGPLSIFLGAYGMASCPDIRSTEGSEHFRRFYELAAIVLGGR